MTHMHIPDGILPAWLWVSGLVLMAVFLAFSLYRLRAADAKKKIPLLGAMAAAMLVVMNIPEILLPYHMNLSVATGILLGPSLGFVAAFIVNLMLALVGHGGVTVMGLNTLLLGSEAVLGHVFFSLFRNVSSIFRRGAAATVLALFFVSVLLIAMVGISHTDVAEYFHGHEEGAGGTHEAVQGHGGAGPAKASLTAFAVMVLSLGVIGWVLEGAITGAVLQFISRVKPDLLAHALHRDSAAAPAEGQARGRR